MNANWRQTIDMIKRKIKQENKSINEMKFNYRKSL